MQWSNAILHCTSCNLLKCGVSHRLIQSQWLMASQEASQERIIAELSCDRHEMLGTRVKRRTTQRRRLLQMYASSAGSDAIF